MLGRGLESLIPPRQKGSTGQDPKQNPEGEQAPYGAGKYASGREPRLTGQDPHRQEPPPLPKATEGQGAEQTTPYKSPPPSQEVAKEHDVGQESPPSSTSTSSMEQVSPQQVFFPLQGVTAGQGLQQPTTQHGSPPLQGVSEEYNQGQPSGKSTEEERVPHEVGKYSAAKTPSYIVKEQEQGYKDNRRITEESALQKVGDEKLSISAERVEENHVELSEPAIPDQPIMGENRRDPEHVPVPESTAVFQVEIEKIYKNPYQPRRNFDEESLRELAVSIREFGILQPLVVSKIEQQTDWGWSVYYELIAGERRYLAAKIIGLQTVPVIIREPLIDREKLELAVIENVQRENLNPIEFARAAARLQDEFGMAQREVAARLGKSREVIANAVRLLSLPSEIQEAVAGKKISESHARLLLSIGDQQAQEKLFREILGDNPTVREVQARVKRIKKGDYKTGFVDPDITSLREELEEYLGTKVDLMSKGESGKITINYYSPEELDSIIEKLLKDRRAS